MDRREDPCDQRVTLDHCEREVRLQRRGAYDVEREPCCEWNMPLPAAPVRTHARSMRTDTTDAPDSSSPADSSTTTAATTSRNDEQRFLHGDQLDTHTVRTLNLTGCMFEDSEISEQQAKLRWKNEKNHDHHICHRMEADLDDEDESDGAPLRTPSTQMASMISSSELKTAQNNDTYCQQIISELWREEAGELFSPPRSKTWEIMNGVLCRLTENEHGGDDTLRPVVPESLRTRVLKNHHVSIWGCHRYEKSTFRDIASRYFWPGMYGDVREFVSKCDVCQLAKGGAPTKQGLLMGRHYSHVFSQLCMDLVGPINQDSGSDARYLLVILDPFTHFVWIELIDDKAGDTVYKAFVNRILLEEGVPRAMLTDNGGEFKNKVFSELMTALKINHQFSPAYHPQSNQTERANRNCTELLRAVVNETGARRRDWPRYVKYVEFAMRRTPIPGTNITPYQMMRGREPVLPIDLPLLSIDGEIERPTVTMPEHVNRLKREAALACKLVKSAREKVMQKNKDLHDLSHKHVQFAAGELVRLWRAQRTTNGDVAKLKLRNSVFKVTGRHNNSYDLENVKYPEITYTNVHVSQIARWRGPAPLIDNDGDVQPIVAAEDAAAAPVAAQVEEARAPPNEDSDDEDDEPETTETRTAVPLSPQAKLWNKLKVNKMCCFVHKDDPPSFLRIAEVISIANNKRSGEFWYWIHSGQCKVYQPETPLIRRRLTPEWSDRRGKTCVKPKIEARANLSPRQHELNMEDIDIILPTLRIQVGGQVFPADIEKIDAWLREQGKTRPRAHKALSNVRMMSSECATDIHAYGHSNHSIQKHSMLCEHESALHRFVKHKINSADREGENTFGAAAEGQAERLRQLENQASRAARDWRP